MNCLTANEIRFIMHFNAYALCMEDWNMRKQFKFWLDDRLDTDVEIDGIVTRMKATRQYTQAIRDGIRLIWDLKNGGHAVLLELFPNIRERLQVTCPPPSGDEFRKIVTEVIRGEMSKAQQSTPINPNIPDTRQGGFPLMSGLMPANQSGPKPIAAPQFSIPEPDGDDGDTIVLNKATGYTDASAMMARVTEMMAGH